jgi:transcriptional regulator with XRE-family HTH domain
MNNNLNLSDRLREVVDHYGLTVNELASKIGGSRMKFYNLMKGASKPDFGTTEAILNNFPDISAEWLMRGDGPMLKKEIVSQEEVNAIIAENKAIKAMYRAELLGKSKGAIISLDRGKELRILTAKTLLANSRKSGKNVKSKTLSVRVQGAVIPSILNNLN